MKDMKVLLQEQADALRAVIRPMLAGHQMSVIEVKDPWEAAALVARDAPDVVLLSATDVYERGRDVPQLLASGPLRTPTLILGASEPRSMHVSRLPVDGYLPYPFDAPRLLQAIKSVVAAGARQTLAAEV